MTERQPYVTVSDVLDVSSETYQTAAAREWMLIRGERSMRRCDEPAYTLSAHKTPAFIDPSYEVGSADKISDIEVSYRRFDVDDYMTLQTMSQFDVGHTTKTDAVSVIGNAVPPRLAEAIGEEVQIV